MNYHTKFGVMRVLNTHICLLYTDGRYLPATTDGPGIWSNTDRERGYARAREMQGLCVTLQPSPSTPKLPVVLDAPKSRTMTDVERDLQEYENEIWRLAQ